MYNMYVVLYDGVTGAQCAFDMDDRLWDKLTEGTAHVVTHHDDGCRTSSHLISDSLVLSYTSD